jgi:endoglucanase
MKKIGFVIILFFVYHISFSQTIVQRHGKLSVQGASIKDECGNIAQLKGMSFFWHLWYGTKYWNADVVKWLRDDWKVEIIRAPVGVLGKGTRYKDYLADSTAALKPLRALVNGAIEHGIYIIIDFHAHPNFTTEAKMFFNKISKEFGAYPNVIYEIWNEPIGTKENPTDKWQEIKPYAKEMIATIRANDPDNIIIVGTPFYDQFVNVAADDPITTDVNNNPVSNIAYTLHVYTDAHSFNGMVGDNARYALSKGLPMWVTECGATSTSFARPRATDINKPNHDSFEPWEAWMDTNGISYTKWSMSTKDEYGSNLLPGAPIRGKWNPKKHLTDEGRFNRDHFRKVNTLPENCNRSLADTVIRKND